MPGTRPGMTTRLQAEVLARLAARRRRDLDLAALDHHGNRDGPDALEKAAHFVPSAALEQVVMACLRHDGHGLRVGGGVKHVPRLVERDDGVASAMNDKERRLNLADAVDGAILI